MFFWFGVSLFDSKKLEYGGFNHFIAGRIFKWRYRYVIIYLRWSFIFKLSHEDEDFYYDGFHNLLQIGPLQISYGT